MSSLSEFKKKCYEPQTDWIVITPFSQTFTNVLLQESESLSIAAVVIVHETQINAGGYYNHPKIVAIADPQQGLLIQQNSLPKLAETTAKLTHTYITDCPLILGTLWFYWPLIALYVMVSNLWAFT